MKTYIHLIRHGITAGNRDGLFYGATDYPLVEEGYASLRTLKAEGIYPDGEGACFYISGLTRCRQTLETIYGEKEAVTLPLLREIDCGEYEGMPFEIVNRLPDYRAWTENRDNSVPMPGGESMKGFYSRVSEGFDMLMEAHEKAGRTSIAVIHGAVICCIMSRLFGSGLEGEFWKWLPDPGRGYTVILEDGRPAEYEKIG